MKGGDERKKRARHASAKTVDMIPFPFHAKVTSSWRHDMLETVLLCPHEFLNNFRFCVCSLCHIDDEKLLISVMMLMNFEFFFILLTVMSDTPSKSVTSTWSIVAIILCQQWWAIQWDHEVLLDVVPAASREQPSWTNKQMTLFLCFSV